MRWPWVNRELVDREREFNKEILSSALREKAAVRELLEREREAIEQLRATASQERGEVARLTTVIIKMRRRSFDHVDPKKPTTPPDVDGAAVQRAERQGVRRHARSQFISRAVADLLKRGTDPVAAEREAERLWEETSDLHPAGG